MSIIQDYKDLKQTIKNWWLFVILGVLLIIGGIWVMMTPLESYIALAIVFSVMIFVNGIFDVIFSISNSKILKGWGWYLAGGILEILMGIVLMIHPEISITILPLILGFWLMFGGVSTISGAFDLKSYYVKGWGWVLVLGILLMIFSFIVLANPVFGASTVVVFTALAIISYGIAYLIFGIKLKKVKSAAGDIKKAVLGGIDDLKKDVLASIKEAADSQAGSQDVNKKFDSFKDSLSE
jgi:uncharacterized membrane protein HdeD (DUF308 family)